MTKQEVKRTERGWAGHFICADTCLFRRNTLLEYGDVKIVVSTVGLMRRGEREKIETIGHNRYYETMIFHSKKDDHRYHDADVHRGEINFESPWSIDKEDADDKANDMHEVAVNEIMGRLRAGDKLRTSRES